MTRKIYVKRAFTAVMTVGILLLSLVFSFGAFQQSAGAAESKGLVVVDPGHIWSSGGSDPGNIGIDGTRESDLNLQLSEKIIRELQKRGYTVYTTFKVTADVPYMVEGGRPVNLEERWRASNDIGADMYICVHHNSDPGSSASKGWLMLLNTADRYAYPEVEPLSRELSAIIRDSLYKLNYTRGNRATGLQVQERGTNVIMYNKAPVAYLESGFLSNQDDLKVAKSSTRQAEIAEKLVDGVDEYFRRHPAEAPDAEDTAAPKISSVAFSEKSPTQKESFVIKAKNVTDDSSGVDYIKFRVWRNGVSSTKKTYTGKSDGAGSYTMTFKLADFGNAAGMYKATAYAYDKAGNMSSLTGSIEVKAAETMDTAIPTMGTLEFVGQGASTEATEFTIRANDVVDATGVKTVKFTVWRSDDKEGTKKILSAANKGNGKWETGFKLSDYGNVPGTYKVAVSGWDSLGNKGTMKTGQIKVLGTPIMGASRTTVNQMAAYFTASGRTYPSYYEEEPRNTSLKQFAQMYFDVCAKEGVRAEIAWAQMCHETGYLQFGGDVDISQFNFAGLGATGGGARGFDFSARYGDSARGIKYGIIGQVQHLKCYACKDDVAYKNADGTPVDPRWAYVTRGSAPTVEQLNKWAADTSYTSTLVRMVKSILATQAVSAASDGEAMEVVTEGGEVNAVELAGADEITPAEGGREKIAYPVMKGGGAPGIPAAQLVNYYTAHAPGELPQTYGMGAEEFTSIFIEECAMEGVNAEVAFAVAMRDTNFLGYEGGVAPEQYLYYGYEGAESHAYADVRQGIRALVQRLKCLASDAAALANETVYAGYAAAPKGSIVDAGKLGGDRYEDELLDMIAEIMRTDASAQQPGPDSYEDDPGQAAPADGVIIAEPGPGQAADSAAGGGGEVIQEPAVVVE